MDDARWKKFMGVFRTGLSSSQPESSAALFEARGKLASYFDKLNDDIWLEENWFEKAQRKLFEQVV